MAMAKLIVPNNLLCRVAYPTIRSVRCKSFKVKRKWASSGTKNQTPNELALQHFDFFYRPIFQRDWPSIRLGFLSDQKYCALVNSYGQSEKIVKSLEELGTYDLFKKLREISESRRNRCAADTVLAATADVAEPSGNVAEETNLRSHLDFPSASRTDPSSLMEFTPAVPKPKSTGLHAKTSDEAELNPMDESWIDRKIPVIPDGLPQYPANLHAMTFPPGNISVFPQAPPDNGVVSYYLMDAASLLPVLALNLQPGDLILDMCAAPGGKSLIMLQTLYPGGLVCNEPNPSRINRLRQVLDSYLPGSAEIRDNIVLKHKDAASGWDEVDRYDKVLIDAPCTADRQSLVGEESDGNIFKRSRSKERMAMPNIQTEILFNGLKSLRRGGTLVYATCSLSPLQGDGVVERAVQKVWRKTRMEVVVRDLAQLCGDFEESNICRFSATPTSYGRLVVPFIVSNFGPMYFCKLQRIQ